MPYPAYPSLRFQHCCPPWNVWGASAVTGRLHTFPRHRSAFPWGFRFREVRMKAHAVCCVCERPGRIDGPWPLLAQYGDTQMAWTKTCHKNGSDLYVIGRWSKHTWKFGPFWTHKWCNFWCLMSMELKVDRDGLGLVEWQGSQMLEGQVSLPGILTEWQEVQKRVCTTQVGWNYNTNPDKNGTYIWSCSTWWEYLSLFKYQMVGAEGLRLL